MKPTTDDAVKSLRGPLDHFAAIIDDKELLMEKVCDYAQRRAAREKVPPWSIINYIFEHGSGVSNAIYERYRSRKDESK